MSGPETSITTVRVSAATTTEYDSDEIKLVVDSAPAAAEVPHGACSVCAKGKATYRSVPCGCNTYCKTCAMKLATGGRCRTCKELYVAMKAMS